MVIILLFSGLVKNLIIIINILSVALTYDKNYENYMDNLRNIILMSGNSQKDYRLKLI